MPDRITALVTLLSEDATLADEVQGRVYDSELPDEQISEMPRPVLIVRAAGGGTSIGAHSTQEIGDTRVDILAYAATPRYARALYEGLHAVLKGLERTVVGDTLIHWCRPAGGPNQMREPGVTFPGGVPDNTVHWPFVASSWQVLAAEIPVPA